MNQPNRRLSAVPSNSDGPTRQEIFIARIEQQHRERIAAGFKCAVYSDPEVRRPVLDQNEVSRRATKIVVVDAPVPRVRLILKKLGLMK